MKIITIIIHIFLMVLLLSACSKKSVVEENPPGMDSLRQRVTLDIPTEIMGLWERCEADQTLGKSTHTKVSLSNTLEVRVTTYQDSNCQLIDSTKEKTITTFYQIEMEGAALKAKIQSRRLGLYNREDVKAFNQANDCGHNDWKVRTSKEVLGVPCVDLPRDNKHDLAFFTISRSGENLIFADQQMKRATEPKEEVVNATIVNSTSSEVIPEPGSKNVMLVLPPKKEILKIKVPKISAHESYCDTVFSTHQSSLSSRARLAHLINDVKKQQQQLRVLNENVNGAIAELLEYVETHKLQEFHVLIKEYDELEEVIEEAQLNYKHCTTNCNETWARLKELKDQRTQLNYKFGGLRVPRRVSKGYYAQVNSIAYAEGLVQKQQEIIAQKKKLVSNAEEKHLELFDDLATKEGATANIKFVSLWSQNVKELIKANPSYKFRLAEVSKVVMSYKLSGIKNYPGASSILTLPIKDARLLVKGRILFKDYPNTMSGPVKLSVLATCPLQDPQAYELNLSTPDVLEYELNFSYEL